LGLALHNYHDAHSVFPQGLVPGVYTGVLCDRMMNGAFAMILPFMDETSLYNAINMDRGFGPVWYAQYSNSTVARSGLAQYVCPSHRSPVISPDRGFSVNDYAFCRGASTNSSANCHKNPWAATDQGMFDGSTKLCRMRDIRDGTSNTIAAGEFGGGPSVAGDWASCLNRSGNGWAFPYEFVILANAGIPMNAPCAGNGLSHAFFSMHEGGCFFLFADGQVRFLSENIDATAYDALGTIAGNELVDDEDY